MADVPLEALHSVRPLFPIASSHRVFMCSMYNYGAHTRIGRLTDRGIHRVPVPPVKMCSPFRFKTDDSSDTELSPRCCGNVANASFINKKKKKKNGRLSLEFDRKRAEEQDRIQFTATVQTS